MLVQLFANVQTSEPTVLPWLGGCMAQLIAECQLHSSNQLARHLLSLGSVVGLVVCTMQSHNAYTTSGQGSSMANAGCASGL